LEIGSSSIHASIVSAIRRHAATCLAMTCAQYDFDHKLAASQPATAQQNPAVPIATQSSHPFGRRLVATTAAKSTLASVKSGSTIR